jgi:hypothetical protein
MFRFDHAGNLPREHVATTVREQYQLIWDSIPEAFEPLVVLGAISLVAAAVIAHAANSSDETAQLRLHERIVTHFGELIQEEST